MAGAFVILALFVIISPLLFLYWYEKRQKNTWEIVGEGVFKSIKYHDPPPRRSVIIPKIGVVEFEDGNYCMVTALDVPPQGTYIRIYKNGLADFRIEEIIDKSKK